MQLVGDFLFYFLLKFLQQEYYVKCSSVVTGRKSRAITDCIKDDLYWPAGLGGIDRGCLSQGQTVGAGYSVSSLLVLIDIIYFR